MRFLLILFTTLNINISHAELQPIVFGHNLSATSHVLDPGNCSVGLLTVACGIAEDLAIGSSPWLFMDYNMYSFFARYRIEKTEDYEEVLQLGLFQTDSASRTYDMSAVWLYWIHGYDLAPHYNLFLNIQGAYYFNENRPFSLRRPRVWKDPTDWNFTTLHELTLVNGFYIMGEVGFLGVVRKYPQIHTGASIQWRSKRWLIQAGFTNTGTLQAYWSPSNRQDIAQSLSNGRDHGLGDGSSDILKYDFSIHPEFVIQFYF
ncbi:MAG: hypothetical protein HRT44_02995 [Bdellovibrionales bacterium]|nr:hypothetical protein [Bdellovibrionales bacterium]NQZ18213.1 hypothetical protein [Bdellovibrionales bacterium]